MGNTMNKITPDVDEITVVAEYITFKDLKNLKESLSSVMSQKLGWKSIVKTKNYQRFFQFPHVALMGRKEVIKAKKDDKYFTALRLIRPSVPMDLVVIFEKINDETKLSVSCLPAMYYQVQQIKEMNKYSVFSIKSVVLECQNFMDEIFVGDLGCKRQVPPHPKKPLEIKSYELLVNYKMRELSEKIKSALKNAKREIYLCGWVGQVVIPLLQDAKRNGIKIKIITKTPAKETRGYRDKEVAINRIREFLDKDDIRLVSTCHSRILLIDDDNVFVGSMDMDSESFDQREECAIWSNDPNLVVKGKVYFEDIFKKGKKLSENLLISICHKVEVL
jgi:hypothetical protein